MHSSSVDNAIHAIFNLIREKECSKYEIF
jgi:hypothetical protein